MDRPATIRVAAVRTRHVVRIGSETGATAAALMRSYPLALSSLSQDGPGPSRSGRTALRRSQVLPPSTFPKGSWLIFGLTAQSDLRSDGHHRPIVRCIISPNFAKKVSF